MTTHVAINGEISGAADAKISVFDRGFLFGDGVFETLVAFDGRILSLEEHLERLRFSATEVDLEVPWSDAQIKFEFEHLLEMSGKTSHKKSLRLIVSRGSGFGLAGNEDLKPNRVAIVQDAPLEEATLYKTGMALKRKIAPYTLRGPAPKSSNYQRSIVALRAARQEGFPDILWTNSEGEITEASTANVFFIGRHGDAVEILTPSSQSGLLVGTTRNRILRLLALAKIKASEQIIFADELPRFDEAFVCSTVRGLVPVKQIDGQTFHSARAGSVFRHIERLYLTWVQSELGHKVDWRTGGPVNGK